MARLALPGLALGLLAPYAGADVLTLVADRDNTLYESRTGGTSNGSGAFFFSGKNRGSFEPLKTFRSLVHFDTSGIPAGSTIQSVEVTLRMNKLPTGAPPADVSLHEVAADWGEGTSDATGGEGDGAPATAGDATWVHRFFPGTFWTNTGGDFDVSASATETIAGVATYTWASTPALVADVQGWVDAAGTNFGWLVKHDDESGTRTARRFAAREATMEANRPIVVITFDPPPCNAASFCTANANSTGSPAAMSQSGSCVVATGALTLEAGPVPDQSFLFFYGPGQIQVPFGNGFLCVGGGQTRVLPPGVASGNLASRTVDPGALGFVSAQSVNFQCWFRDPPGGGAFFNTSDGLSILFQ